MPKDRSCVCASALQYAILTDRAAIPADTKEKLNLLIGKYIGETEKNL
jgi:5'-methylthioadenosine phosphorylase